MFVFFRYVPMVADIVCVLKTNSCIYYTYMYLWLLGGSCEEQRAGRDQIDDPSAFEPEKYD